MPVGTSSLSYLLNFSPSIKKSDLSINFFLFKKRANISAHHIIILTHINKDQMTSRATHEQT